MTDSILEKSLDEIIGDTKPKRRFDSSKRKKSKIAKPNRAREQKVRISSSLPGNISRAAKSRPILRVKNIHPDLNGNDLSGLFGSISEVDFVLFDPKHSDIAYVCYQRNQSKNNSIAISKFDGRKAMGQNLVVENATSLADRILAPQTRFTASEKPKSRHSHAKGAAKPQKKSVDTLDDELDAYMNRISNSSVPKDTVKAPSNSGSPDPVPEGTSATTTPITKEDGMNLD